MKVPRRFYPQVTALLAYLRKMQVLETIANSLHSKLEDDSATDADRSHLLEVLDEMQGAVATYEEHLAQGPLLTCIAKTQIAMLRKLSESNQPITNKKYQKNR